jgi:hypothetical protein
MSALGDEPMERRSTSFDGGARESVPLPPPSHEQTLKESLAARSADVGWRM